ncbi:hypothetical protein ONE63_001801 [Megalurothrips usitatus]|uniref:Uncharacterized protein n=1 Tax=Megalurothrips usitatus TaxID=439358 RepID=A0AAV7XBV0_9NEOP|nr:hypothetical protein ONE63_001801 [Megalurothrips usitatus]
MSLSASRMEKAETAVQSVEIKLVPSYTLKLLVFLSVLLLVTVCLFPVVVTRLAVMNSRIEMERFNAATTAASAGTTSAPAQHRSQAAAAAAGRVGLAWAPVEHSADATPRKAPAPPRRPAPGALEDVRVRLAAARNRAPLQAQ